MKNILNDTSRSMLLVVIVVLVGIILYQNYTEEIPTVTTTELIIDYKGYVVVSKKDFKRTNIYYLKLRNPYTNKDKDIRVLSGLYFNYYVGDTIGNKKQVFNFN